MKVFSANGRFARDGDDGRDDRAAGVRAQGYRVVEANHPAHAGQFQIRRDVADGGYEIRLAFETPCPSARQRIHSGGVHRIRIGQLPVRGKSRFEPPIEIDHGMLDGRDGEARHDPSAPSSTWIVVSSRDALCSGEWTITIVGVVERAIDPVGEKTRSARRSAKPERDVYCSGVCPESKLGIICESRGATRKPLPAVFPPRDMRTAIVPPEQTYVVNACRVTAQTRTRRTELGISGSEGGPETEPLLYTARCTRMFTRCTVFRFPDPKPRQRQPVETVHPGSDSRPFHCVAPSVFAW